MRLEDYIGLRMKGGLPEKMAFKLRSAVSNARKAHSRKRQEYMQRTGMNSNCSREENQATEAQ